MSNPYLDGNFGPVTEELTTGALEVTGELPDWLDGRYLRIGPNPLGATDPATYHWFLGDGMVHGVRLRDGRAEWYRNRYVRSDHVATALGESPIRGRRHAGFDLSPNTNVIQHGGRTLALIEAGPRPYELTDDLDTVGPCDFDGTLRGGYTAHPHTDPATGELHSISYFWGWGNRVRYDVVGADGRVRRSVDVRTHGRPMIHDFALTENHVVLFDLPVSFNPKRAVSPMPAPMRPVARATLAALSRVAIPASVSAAMAGGGGTGVDYGALAFPYTWDPSYPARVGVLPRSGTSKDVRWFEVDPCYVFHTLNAYEDGDTIVCDVVRHPKSFATEMRGPNEGPPTLERWRIDLTSGKVLEERVDDQGQEFPRIDERLTGRRHRYGYAVGVGPEGSNCVIKHDLVSGGRTVQQLGPSTGMASEFVFVPAADDAAEDDGVLMGFGYDGETDRSDLTLLDAGTLEPVAAVHLPVRVPQGFHGNWAPTVSSV
jgi:carotenoid cleavage dioxygenase